MDSPKTLSPPDPIFDVNAYRSKNQDLKDLPDEKLFEHFRLYGHREPRIFCYCKTTVDRMSMKHLRGEGLEMGAGDNPTPLYGGAVCTYADISAETVFGRTGAQTIIYDINHPTPLGKTFDFVIASHVLEHIDSLARGLMTLGRLLKPEGIAYIILPNREKDGDHFWMPDFGFPHHLIELFLPGIFRKRHERDFCQGMGDIDSRAGWGPVQQKFSNELIAEIRKGKLSAQHRYIYHRHSYDFCGWTRMLLFLTGIIRPRMRLIDAGEGDERSDCHFVFKRSSLPGKTG